MIRRSTWKPAREIRHTELGHLSAGAPADVAVLRVERGDFGFIDDEPWFPGRGVSWNDDIRSSDAGRSGLLVNSWPRSFSQTILDVANTVVYATVPASIPMCEKMRATANALHLGTRCAAGLPTAGGSPRVVRKSKSESDRQTFGPDRACHSATFNTELLDKYSHMATIRRHGNSLIPSLASGRVPKLSEDEILETLREEGVKDLQGLVRRMLASGINSEPRTYPESTLLDIQMISTPTPVEITSKIVHGIPAIPFIVGKTEYDPKDITRFNGQELHFVLANHQRGGPVLITYQEKTNPIMNYLQTKYTMQLGQVWELGYVWPTDYGPGPGWPPPPPPVSLFPPGGSCGVPGTPPCGSKPPAATPRPPWYKTQIEMFEGADYQSDFLWLDAGWAWQDLTRVSRGQVLFFHGDWNDCISSLSGTGTTCTYYEDINYQGSSLTLAPFTSGEGIPNLALIGWNDRISSVVNWG